MRVLLLVALVGCDYVVGLEKNIDAAVDPEAPNPCVVEPDFNTYRFEMRTRWGTSSEAQSHPSLDRNNVALFNTLGGVLYAANADTTMAFALGPTEPGIVRFHPSRSHDGKAGFFQRRDATTSAFVDVVRWDIAQAINLRTKMTFNVAGLDVAPGNSASYRGMHRMVVWLTEQGTYRLVEMESSDLDTWNEVVPPTMPWALPSAHEYDSNLSADGCSLLFTSDRGGTQDIYFAWRGGNGKFGSPVKLVVPNQDLYERGITLAPDGRLWFYRGVGEQQVNQELVVGIPP